MNKLTKNDNLVQELKSLIASTKEKVTVSVNASLTLLYWHIGEKVEENILQNSRANYGKEIVHSLSTQLTWTHIRSLITIEDELKRTFYIEMTKLDKWSTRTLNDRIDSMLYERTALSKKPDELITYELLELDKSDIHVAKYMTVLPSKEEFEQKLHKVVANAKLKYQK